VRHEAAVPLLLEALETKGENVSDLDEHLRGCEECRSTVETLGAVARAFEGHDAPGAHLTSEDVVLMAMDPDAAAPRDGDLRDHLRACARCAWEVRNVRSAESDSTFEVAKGKAVEARSLAPNWPAIGAGFAVLALLYPAYLGTFRLPAVAEQRRALLASGEESKTRIAALEGSLAETRGQLERSTAWNGPVQVPVLTPALPGRAPRVAHVPVENGQPVIALALDLTDADRRLGPGMHRVRVAGSDGNDLWILDLTGSEIRDRVSVGGVLTVFVPAAALPQGRYTVTLAPVSGEPIFASPLSVTTGGFRPSAP
jgi:hypothetical protein